MKPPTPRQKEILDYIRAYTTGHGYPPTVREIGDEVGLYSPSSVHHHLCALERAGRLRRAEGRSRAVVVVEPGEVAA